MNSSHSEELPIKRAERKARSLSLYREAQAIAAKTFEIPTNSAEHEQVALEHQRRILSKHVGGTLISKDRKHQEVLDAQIEVSLIDPLTNAYTRAGLQVELVKTIARLRRARVENKKRPLDQRTKTDCSVLFIDLNDLKEVNDQKGHREGDLLLQRTVLALQEEFRTNDIVARIGGDEFVVVAEGATVDDVLTFIKERLVPRKINAAIGIAPLNERNPWESVGRADKAMYEAKEIYGRTDRNVPIVDGRRFSG